MVEVNDRYSQHNWHSPSAQIGLQLRDELSAGSCRRARARSDRFEPISSLARTRCRCCRTNAAAWSTVVRWCWGKQRIPLSVLWSKGCLGRSCRPIHPAVVYGTQSGRLV